MKEWLKDNYVAVAGIAFYMLVLIVLGNIIYIDFKESNNKKEITTECINGYQFYRGYGARLTEYGEPVKCGFDEYGEKE
jgi:hypothetical protein